MTAKLGNTVEPQLRSKKKNSFVRSRGEKRGNLGFISAGSQDKDQKRGCCLSAN